MFNDNAEVERYGQIKEFVFDQSARHGDSDRTIAIKGGNDGGGDGESIRGASGNDNAAHRNGNDSTSKPKSNGSAFDINLNVVIDRIEDIEHSANGM